MTKREDGAEADRIDAERYRASKASLPQDGSRGQCDAWNDLRRAALEAERMRPVYEAAMALLDRHDGLRCPDDIETCYEWHGFVRAARAAKERGDG